jgi:anthranilate/para-aminobenzoate synthase component II
MASAIQVLGTVQHTSLQYLFVSPGPGTADEWAALSTILTRPRFARLNTLSVLLPFQEKDRVQARAALAPLQERPAFRWEKKLW